MKDAADQAAAGKGKKGKKMKQREAAQAAAQQEQAEEEEKKRTERAANTNAEVSALDAVRMPLNDPNIRKSTFPLYYLSSDDSLFFVTTADLMR